MIHRTGCRSAVIVLTLLSAWAATPSFAATADDFYRNLLQRGIAQADAGEYDAAAKVLRIAAFGLVDFIDEFETAHVYLAIAHDGLKREAEARASAQRVLAAERITRRYATLNLPPAVRARFEAIAGRLLTADQLAALRGSAPPPAAPAPTTIVRRATSTSPAATNGPTPVPTTPVPAPSPPPAPVQAAAPPPAPVPAPLQPAQPRVANVAAELNQAGEALARNDLTAARRILHTLHGLEGLDHSHRIRIAEGLTRARDFEGAVQAFQRLTTFRSGEEPYRFYYAISLYETGDYGLAKRELLAALPHIETTPDVARYRDKIDAALN